MDDVAIARAVHVVAIVLWIGGVAMVTSVLLPAVRGFKSAGERVKFFETIEHRFAWQARGTTLLAGVSGFYMMHRLQLWPVLLSATNWWLDAMLLVWLIFTLMLFIIEPLFFTRWLETRARLDPEGAFALIQRLHWVLLALSLITIFGAVAGSHGLSVLG